MRVFSIEDEINIFAENKQRKAIDLKPKALCDVCVIFDYTI